MFLQIVSVVLILFASQFALAQHAPKSTNQTLHCEADVCPVREPRLLQVKSDTSASYCPNNTATHDEQQLLLQQKCAELDRLQREIKQLRATTGTAQQILVKVQILEVSLTKMRNMGLDTDWFANGYVSETQIQQLLGATSGNTRTSTAEPVSEPNGNLHVVDWLKRNNLAKAISEPTLVTVSGRPASLKVGGEFPVPSKDNSKAAVDFRCFGTELDLLALALGDNQVQLEVRTRVSEVDYAHAIEIDGTRVPGLKMRQFDTGFELPFNQAGILTGLVQQRTEAYQVEGGQTKEVIVDVGLMFVVTPELIPPLEVPVISANRDLSRATKK